jgi:hypothetical protein
MERTGHLLTASTTFHTLLKTSLCATWWVTMMSYGSPPAKYRKCNTEESHWIGDITVRCLPPFSGRFSCKKGIQQTRKSPKGCSLHPISPTEIDRPKLIEHFLQIHSLTRYNMELVGYKIVFLIFTGGCNKERRCISTKSCREYCRTGWTSTGAGRRHG